MFLLRLSWICAGLALILPDAGVAESGKPKPFPVFEAKRIQPPKPGQRQTLVQIPLAETIVRKEEPKAEDPAAPSGAPSPGRYAWFWDSVSPARAESGPGRLEVALTALAAKGDVAAPRLSTLQKIARDRGTSILKSTVGTRVSPALVLAVISVESAGREDAKSPAGAQGLMQLMPATAERFGVANAFAADENIGGGVKYLDFLMSEFERDPILVLAGYNAGEGAVRSHDGVPPYAETRDYVPKVLAAFKMARALCLTPPELITDGCVFRRF